MSMEIGGGNGVRPLMAAAHLKRPVVDTDTMGRAYPEGQMTSVAIGGLAPYPVSMVDVRGIESIVHKVPTWKWTERVARKICAEYGASASTCRRRAPARRSSNGASTAPRPRRSRSAPRCARRSAGMTIRSPPSWPSSPASCCSGAR